MKASQLKKEMPDYICPDLNPICDALTKAGRDDLLPLLEYVRKATVNMRYVAKTAIRELGKKEQVLRELAKHLPEENDD